MIRPSEVLSIESVVENTELLQAWESLREELDASYFLSPGWMVAWWRWAESPPGHVAIWQNGAGHIEALVALVSVRERLHPNIPGSVSFLTNLGSGVGSADHHGWLSKEHLAVHVWKWIREQSKDTTILLRSLAPAIQDAMPTEVIEVDQHRCPRMKIEEGIDAISSKSLKKNARYYLRRLGREGASFRWIPPSEITEDIVDLLFRLHGDRHSLKEEDSTFKKSQADLHREVIRLSDGSGVGPAAVVAEADGEPIGILYGFLTSTVFAYFQSGWSPDWAKLSLGTALTASAIRFAAENGVKIFDFLRGPERYKYRYGAEDVIDKTILLPSGVHGSLLGLKHFVKGQFD